jgi:hypothetical protein
MVSVVADDDLIWSLLKILILIKSIVIDIGCRLPT